MEGTYITCTFASTEDTRPNKEGGFGHLSKLRKVGPTLCWRKRGLNITAVIKRSSETEKDEQGMSPPEIPVYLYLKPITPICQTIRVLTSPMMMATAAKGLIARDVTF